jgi:hypothetical protein
VAGEGVDDATGDEAVGAGAPEHADRITAMATMREDLRKPLSEIVALIGRIIVNF